MVLKKRCPKRMVYVNDMPFEKWEETRDPLKEKFRDIGQVAVKETIYPQYIVGCLNVEEREQGLPVGSTKLRINNCK